MKKFGFIIFVTVIVGGLVLWSNTSNKNTKEQKAQLTSRDVALTCTTDMATEFHIHPELHIIKNNVEIPIPANIGITSTCMNSIHTHTGDGIIHVEAPIARDFTLGDFFAVWQKDFSSTKLMDDVVTENSEIVVTVNGQKVDTYENTILRDKDKIVISFQTK